MHTHHHAWLRFGALLLLCCTLLGSCASQRLDERRAAAARIPVEAGWDTLKLDTGQFVLAAFVPPALHHAETLTVYIEGDGLAWINADTPSFDPTPLDPLALQLALRDQSNAVVYLARPCQFVTGDGRRGCSNKYWTSHRFAPEVIHSSSRAIDQLKSRYGASKVILIGYSGGGAVAALVAAERPDVTRLITVAGNLDHRQWTTQHRLSPLTGSLNPSDAWENLQHIPQTHYVGGQDKVIGREVAASFAAKFPRNNLPDIIVIPGFDHHCCWAEQWPNLRAN